MFSKEISQLNIINRHLFRPSLIIMSLMSRWMENMSNWPSETQLGLRITIGSALWATLTPMSSLYVSTSAIPIHEDVQEETHTHRWGVRHIMWEATHQVTICRFSWFRIFRCTKHCKFETPPQVTSVMIPCHQAPKSIALGFAPWLLLEVRGKLPWWRWCQTNKESSGVKRESGCSICARSSRGFLFKLPHHIFAAQR